MSIWYLLAVAVGLNMLGFLVAYRFKSDKLTDFSYGATFFLLVLMSFLANDLQFYKWLALTMVSLWSGRLAGFLLLRIIKIKKDRRFDGVRESFLKFGQFWLFQGITAWVIVLPTLFLINHSQPELNWLSCAGLVIWAAGLLIETIADAQKFNFNQSLANKGKFISRGLWGYSRHPNYFGEITCWVGLYIFTFNGLVTWEKLAGLASPLYIAFLLIFVTGIPKLEAYADQKWGSQKDYQNYKKSTPALVPFIK